MKELFYKNRQKISTVFICVVFPILFLILLFFALHLVKLNIFFKKQTETISYVENYKESYEQEEAITEKIQDSIAEPVAAPISNFEAKSLSDFNLNYSDVEIDFTTPDEIVIEEEPWTEPGKSLEKNLSSDYSSRCNKKQKRLLLKRGGGNQKTEEAVMGALRWFKKTQNADGSWTERKYLVGSTSLALLAYLGNCQTPLSEEFGSSCTKAILYLIKKAKENDYRITHDIKNHSWVYEHAFATYALAEAYSFCKKMDIEIPQLREVVQKAGQIIIDNQLPEGTWSYEYKTGRNKRDDLSLTSVHLQALKACFKSGIPFKGMKQALQLSKKGMIHFQDSENGGFGYAGNSIDSEKGSTLVGAGILSMQITGYQKNSKEISKAIRYIKKNSRFDFDTEDADLYQHYYISRALFNARNDYWKIYNPMLRDELLKHQKKNGSWENVGRKGGKILAVVPLFHGEGKFATHYRTALCTLILEVYYRYIF